MRLKHLIKTEKQNYTLKFVFVIFIYLSCQTNLKAQENNFDKVLETFKAYSNAYREVAYAQLNKTTFIKGETLGFSSYILNKSSKKPSHLTKNLYCVITDSSNRVIKSKLVKVLKGFSNNQFSIDSLFTSGNYTFKAYTNWMKNFDEHNAFIETFTVIAPKTETVIKRKLIENNIDTQFLPEGGHFVNSVKTNVGVVIKNTEGYGVSGANGTVLDENSKILTTFKTNSFGIGRFLLIPILGKKYTVEITNLGKTFTYIINDIQPKGISINITDLKDKLALEFNTNSSTIKGIKEKPYKLIFHNGKDIKVVDIVFNKNTMTKTITYDELFSGTNIFTLFDENNTPILERLFFNYQGINFLHLEKPTSIKFKDSLMIKIPLNNLKSFDYNTKISASVLPEETKSYQKNHNIVSYTLLQPYVNGYIENAAYYFTDINRKKKYDLDNLLITQGWSSYNWSTIYKGNTTNNFVFEDGILLKANKNSNEHNNFIIYPLENTEGFLVDLPANEKSFIKSGFYPYENEALGMGLLNKKGKTKLPNLYMQFTPSKIPKLNYTFKTLRPKELAYFKAIDRKPFYQINIEKLQKLDQVLIETNVRQTRIKNLKASSIMRVDVFDDSKRSRNLTLPNYLTSKGFFASEQGGKLTIKGTNAQSLIADDSDVVVFLNDVRLLSYEFLLNFDMSRVDYIATSRYGIGAGLRGGNNGVIKIYTSNVFLKRNPNNPFREYNFPLTFAKSKKFYVPKYNVYNDYFFKEYGVMDWIPNCKIDSNNTLNLTIYNPHNIGVKVFLEGITQDGDFIAETKTVRFTK